LSLSLRFYSLIWSISGLIAPNFVSLQDLLSGGFFHYKVSFSINKTLLGSTTKAFSFINQSPFLISRLGHIVNSIDQHPLSICIFHAILVKRTIIHNRLFELRLSLLKYTYHKIKDYKITLDILSRQSNFRSRAWTLVV